jgi:capsid protein
MAILDQYGSPIRNRFARAVNSDPWRGLVFNRQEGRISDLVPSSDRRALAALSRRVVFNTGIAKECIRQKASFSVGGAFAPRFGGSDKGAGEAAVAFLDETWFPEMDLSGTVRTWPAWLELVSKCIDRDGECFILLTRNPDLEEFRPALLMIPAFQIRSQGQASRRINGGEWDGATLEDGIGRDDYGRILFYRVYQDQKEFEDVPAAAMVHLFDREFPEQLRGFPAFAANLSDILQGLESKELEILRQLIVSNVFLMRKGGRPPAPGDSGFETVVNAATGEAVVREKIAPGIQYLRGGEDLEALTHQTPGDIWQSFQGRLWGEAVVGAGWSRSLVRFVSEGGQGTVERGEIVRARLAVRARQGTLEAGAVRFITYGLTDPRAPVLDSLAWGFTKPARLTVDDGREDKALLEMVKAGAMAEEEFQAHKGRSLRDHFIAKARGIELAAEIAAQFEGVNPEDLLISTAPAPQPVNREITLPND